MEAGFKFQPSPEELISDYLVPKSGGDRVKGVPMAVVSCSRCWKVGIRAEVDEKELRKEKTFL
ncbi:unnamed protein product [Dovyalis caffra]|uniref:NAC domain-containing protein n=1 Tax=Dovyalis caffra TaxID=77055 RepID=A0AAV1QPT9_9ROSI|nr:unnamed protein product [Dovyalis caffra]